MGTFLATRDKSAAVEAFSKALNELPGCRYCWIELAKSSQAVLSQDEACTLIMALHVPNADSPDVLNPRAHALIHLNCYTDALDLLEKAADGSRSSDDVSALCNSLIKQGHVLSYLGRYDDALRCFSECLQIEPGNWMVLYSEAITRVRCQGLSSAKAAIARARQALQKPSKSNNYEAVYAQAGIEAVVGNRTYALDLLEKAIRNDKYFKELAQHDIAWSGMRANQRFQALVKDS